MKLLLDTNIAIALEDPSPVNAVDAAFANGCEKHGIARYVADPNYKDVQRDKDAARREQTLSKLDKYPRLRNVALPSKDQLEARFGKTRSVNDECDVELLGILDVGVVDFLISNDAGLKRRGERAGIGSRVLDVPDALAWLKQSYEPLSVELPYIEDVPAYEVDLGDVFFDSLRQDYPGFDDWFRSKCISGHRPCWVVKVESELAGLVIRKEEPANEADCVAKDGKILKISTFKMSPRFQGEKFGEQLLKQVLWWAQTNDFSVVYLTAFEKQTALMYLLDRFGFQVTKTLSNGELVVERRMYQSGLPVQDSDMDPAEYSRSIYPRYSDGSDVQKFVIPIRPEYHKILFPEISDTVDPEVEQLDMFGKVVVDGNRTPGNTIRKVYLCRASTKKMRPGDVVYFYATKEPLYARSQSITSVGVIEAVHEVNSMENLVQLTARRSVYTVKQMEELLAAREGPIKVIDFLLIRHLPRPIPLSELCSQGVFINHPPQSITSVPPNRYTELLKLLSKSDDEPQ